MIPERDQLIWMAGFFDGEGCTSISRVRRERSNGGGVKRTEGDFWFGYTLQIAVSQKQEEPLKRFHDAFGGHLFSYKSRGATYWRWQAWSGGAADCMRALLPYLLVKRGIAELGVRFQEQMTQWNSEYGRTGYPDWVNEGRESFYLQARMLNMRTKSNSKEPKYEGPRSVNQLLKGTDECTPVQ